MKATQIFQVSYNINTLTNVQKFFFSEINARVFFQEQRAKVLSYHDIKGQEEYNNLKDNWGWFRAVDYKDANHYIQFNKVTVNP